MPPGGTRISNRVTAFTNSKAWEPAACFPQLTWSPRRPSTASGRWAGETHAMAHIRCVMTSYSCNLGWRIWFGRKQASASVSLAVLAYLLSTTPSAVDYHPPALQTSSAKVVLPPASFEANVARAEQLSESVESKFPSKFQSDDVRSRVGIDDPQIASSGILPSSAPTPEPEMDEVNQYLWNVYQRTEIKRDGSGDFTWKDIAAATRLVMSLGDYVVRGMDRDFREVLYRAGLAMDAAGIRWTILSAFRDDYRQFLAVGYKARIGDSLHGGSATTGGYGHGCAIDIKDADGDSRALWTWLDANSAHLNLDRPLPGIDPAHMQPRGPWHEVAAALRNERLGKGADSETVATAPDHLNGVAPSEEDMLCIGLHHHRFDPIQAITPPADLRPFKVATPARGLGKLQSAIDKSRPRSAGHLAARAAAPSKGKSAGTREAAEKAVKMTRTKAAEKIGARHSPHAIPPKAGAT
jgi:hypothetical protein